MKGILIFEDRGGKKLPITLNGLDSTDGAILSKMQALALSVESYSNAVVRDYGVIRPDIAVNGAFPGTATLIAGAEHLSALHKGIVTFTYTVDNETRTMNVYIPAPNVEMFDFVPEVGYRMNVSFGVGLRDAMRTATGIADLQFTQGVLEYREGRSARPSEGAFVEWYDAYGRRQYMGLSQVSDNAALQVLANYIKAPGDVSSLTNNVYSFCDWARIGVMVPEVARRTGTALTEQGWDSVGSRGVLKFSWVTGTKRHGMKFTLPAPKSSFFVNPNATARKRRVDPVQGEAVALALTALYGAGVRNLSFEVGVFDKINFSE